MPTPRDRVQVHRLFMLGKQRARRDPRNLRLASVLRKRLTVPAEYDFDLGHPGIPLPMFANDRLGDCVIAGRAHQTLRFEMVERGQLIAISDDEVAGEYLEQSGGADNGLIVLDSLKDWRKDGWTAGGQRLRIQAFAEVDPRDHDEVRSCIYSDVGLGIGLSLPRTAQMQIDAGKPWEVVSGPGSAPGSWGGHYVYLSGYTDMGPTCVTWGRKQRLSWAFLDRYCDEAYAIFDALDTAKLKRLVRTDEIREFLAAL
jgi:hypothetical protein